MTTKSANLYALNYYISWSSRDDSCYSTHNQSVKGKSRMEAANFDKQSQDLTDNDLSNSSSVRKKESYYRQKPRGYENRYLVNGRV